MRLSYLAAGMVALLTLGCGSEETPPEDEPQGRVIIDGQETGPTSRPSEPEPAPAPAPAPAPRPAPPAPSQAPTQATSSPPLAAGGQQRVKLEGDFEPTLEDVMGQIARQVRAQIVVDSRVRDRRVSLEGIDQQKTPWNVLVEILASRGKCRVKSSSSGVLMIVPRR